MGKLEHFLPNRILLSFKFKQKKDIKQKHFFLHHNDVKISYFLPLITMDCAKIHSFLIIFFCLFPDKLWSADHLNGSEPTEMT